MKSHHSSTLAPTESLQALSLLLISAAATHIVQATHANAKTKAYPKSVAAPVRC
jgi:hypothetical protein